MPFSARLSAAVSRTVRQLLAASLDRAARDVAPRHATLVDVLEPRCLFASAAHDLIGLTALRADPVFAGIDGSGVTVAVIDTGVDFDHPLLSTSRVAARDFVRNNNQAEPTDEHGTHVAGIVGARDPDIGVATGVGIIGLQVFTPARNGNVLAYDPDTESALEWVLEHREEFNIVAVNMSLGSGNFTNAGSASDSILFDDVRRLEAAGVTVVSAAGNSYADLETEGSAAPGVFSTIDVGAVYEENEGRAGGGNATDFTTAADRVTFFSQRPNTNNELFAPGAFITSTVPGGGTKDLAGTSMASPMVAGVVSLMQEAAQTFGGRLLSPDEVRNILQTTADAIVDGDDENTSVQTTGNTFRRVDAYAAVQAVRSQFLGTTQSPDPNGTISSAVAGPSLTGAAANPVTGNIGADGVTSVGANDVDMVRFTVASGGTVTVSLNSSAFQPYLRLFNAAGTEITGNTPGSVGTATITSPLDAGTYYVGVSGNPNAAYNPTVAGSGSAAGATGDYTLNFALAGSTDVDGILGAATGINLKSGNVPQALNASVGEDAGGTVGGDDVDFYQVTVPDDGFLLVDIDTLSTPFADTFLRIFDAAGNQVAGATSDDDIALDITGEEVEFDPNPVGLGNVLTDALGNPAGHDTDSFSAVAVTKGSVYYVAVCNFANRSFDPDTTVGRISTGSTGEYSLFVSLRNRDVNGAIPQAFQTSALPVDDNPGTLGTDGGSTQVGDRDVDFIRVDVAAAGILEFNVDSFADAPTVSNPVDAVLRLFSSDGTLLALNDDQGGSLDPLIRFEVAPGTYFAAVAGHGNNAFDPFILGSGGTGDTGDYEFTAQVLPLTSAAALADDTSTGTLTNLALSTPTIANVGDDDGFSRGDTDVDLYTFVAPFTGQFTFTAEPSDDFGVDPFLRLFNADGTQVAFDDNALGGTGGAQIITALTAGQSYLIGVNGASASAGLYDPVTGSGAASGSTGGYVLEATAGQRTVFFDAKKKATFRDADGSTVVVSMKGPGAGTIVFDSDVDADPALIALTGVTNTSTVTVKGVTSIGGLTVSGSLKSLAAKTSSVTGVTTASGSIRTLNLGSLSDATITLGTGDALTMTAGDVFDTGLTATAGIKSLKVNTWTDGDATADVVAAPFITALTSKGDLAANLSSDSIGKVKAGGDLSGNVISTGNILSVTAASMTGANIFAGVVANFVGLPDSPDDFATTAAEVRALVVKGKFSGAFSDTRVAAPLVRRATLGDVASSNGGEPIGIAADIILSASGRLDGSQPFRQRNLDDAADTFTQTDFVLRVM